MPPKDRRMKRVYEGLSARERALMVYADACQEREHDGKILRTMPGHQGYQFNFYIRLVNAIFQGLGPLAWDLHRRAQVINLELLLYRTHVQWSVDRLLLHRDRGDLPGAEDESIDSSGPSAPWNLVPSMRGQPDPVTGKVTRETRRDVFARDMCQQALKEIPAAWRDLLALEKVLGEAVDELGAAEAPPLIRERLDDTRSFLTALASMVDLTTPDGITLAGEADEGEVETLRKIMQNARM